jgi:hypothetical protein
MNIADELTTVAMLGTAKYAYTPHPGLAELNAKLSAQQADKEDGYLRYSAAALLYAECGTEPVAGEHNIVPCPEENAASMRKEPAHWLGTALQTDDAVLLGYLLHKTAQHQQVAPPELVPALLNKAISNRQLAPQLLAVVGEVGKWLISLNPAWQKLDGKLVRAEDTWETGSFEARKLILAEVRATDPAQAIPMLEATLPQENANNRAEFIALLDTGLSLPDEPFLESLANDKSKKVKEEAMGLLRKVPGSRINSVYRDFVLQTLVVKEQRVMLISKKKVLEINTQSVPAPVFFESGIEKVSSEKGVDDHFHWLVQAMAFVSPEDLLKHLNLSAEELVELIGKQEALKPCLRALVLAASRFRYAGMAKALFDQGSYISFDLLRLLPQAERSRYLDRWVDQHATSVIDFLVEDHYPIVPKDLAIKILAKFSTMPYQINQPTYRRFAMQIPVEAIGRMKELCHPPAEDQGQNRYFATQIAEMIRLIEIKESLKF